ncbi:TIGR00341 family protein [Psychrobacter sp. B38]|uniref:TIGR00341 family protein n=1 Tax=Psychrobacter sp. B38 TaxID=3143538 RepID=UPI00320D350C
MTKTQENRPTDATPPQEAVDDIDSNDGDIADDIDQDSACAKPPEAKIKIESLSPDVAVASLETDEEVPSSEAESSIPSEAETVEPVVDDSDAINAETDNAETDNLETKNLTTGNLEAETSEAVSLKTEYSDDNVTDSSEEPALETSNDSLSSDEGTTDGELAAENDEKEEEIKEKKEAKLESYKQFVAEQFNNKKVDYPEVRVTIEANALPSRMYFIMNILSAIIASYGLVTNSAAVVIGAMLVAMMLGPITGVALAIIDHRMPLLRRSIITVLIGVSLVILVGFIIGWLHKDQPLTAEILSRTQPTSMDLMIALAGGTAGAYAMVSPHLSVAVVGVAVATALVPPLAASGILFANGEIQLGFGALLLAITNIIAIQFTNALVLWILGFRRLVDDDYQSNTYLTFLQRNAITLLLLGGLGTYLTINLQTNAKQQAFENDVKEAINSYFIDKGNVLTNTQFDTIDDKQVVRAVIRGETTPTAYDVQQIETTITKDMVENFPKYPPIKLQLRYLPVQVIESNPVIQDQLDETDAAILTN